MNQKNLLVLGGGPGGYTAAFLAADQGMRVTLVDAGARPGGVCLHRGCIPSKALLHLSKLIHETREAEKWGLSFAEPEIDLSRMRDWKDEMIQKMSGGLIQLCKQRGVRFINGHAVFKDSNTVTVSGEETVSFDQCILATGSRPVVPEMFQNAGSRLMDSTAALKLDEIPKRLLIAGGGYIGLEMGTVYAALGSQVTLVELMEELLTGVDRDLVRPLQSRLKNEFKDIFLGTKWVSAEETEEGIRVTMENPSGSVEQVYDRALVAVGRTPNSRDIGLENTGVIVNENGFVDVDEMMKTADPAIYAIGDVTGGAMLAHKASAEAKVAVEAIGENIPDRTNQVIPAVVFTDPEIAWCGMTETEAKKKEIKVEISKFPWGASGRAQTLGRTDGMTKLVLEPQSKRILGVGIVGPGAGDLISEGALAIRMGATARDLAGTVHPHPTLSETLMEAAEACYGTAPHIFRKRK